MISYKSFPKAYVPCFLEQCPLRDTCLHWLYAQVTPTTETVTWSVTPHALLKQNLRNGRCQHYASAEPVTVCADFTHLYDKVRHKDYRALRREVVNYLDGRYDYRRYGLAQRPYLVTPDKARDIAAIFARYGYEAPQYGETFTTYLFD